MKKLCIFFIVLFFANVTIGQKIGTAKLSYNTEEIGDVTIIQYDNTGKFLAVAYYYSRLELWNIDMISKTKVWSKQFNSQIVSVNFIDELNQIVIVLKHIGIIYIDKKTGNLSKTFVINFNRYLKDKPEQILKSDYNEKLNILAVSGNIAGRVIVLNLKTLYGSKVNHPDSIYIVNSIDWDRIFLYPKENSLVAEVRSFQKADSSILYDLSSNIENFEGNAEVITCIKISPSLKFVVAGTKSGKLLKWNLKNDIQPIFPEFIINLTGSRQTSEFKDILGIDCSDSLLVSVCFGSIICGNMQLWNPVDMSMISFKKEADPSTCRKVDLSQGLDYAVTTGDFSYRLWEKTEVDYILKLDLEYHNSVGYFQKIAAVDFFNKMLAVGDQKDVFFYNLSDFSYLFSLRNNINGLKIHRR